MSVRRLDSLIPNNRGFPPSLGRLATGASLGFAALIGAMSLAGCAGPAPVVASQAQAGEMDASAQEFVLENATGGYATTMRRSDETVVVRQTQAQAPLSDGVWSASAASYEADLAVSVKVEKSNVVEITIDSCNDPSAATALSELPLKLAEGQSAPIDVVAGATVTSRALIDAVTECLDQSRLQGLAGKSSKEVQLGTGRSAGRASDDEGAFKPDREKSSSLGHDIVTIGDAPDDAGASALGSGGQSPSEADAGAFTSAAANGIQEVTCPWFSLSLPAGDWKLSYSGEVVANSEGVSWCGHRLEAYEQSVGTVAVVAYDPTLGSASQALGAGFIGCYAGPASSWSVAVGIKAPDERGVSREAALALAHGFAGLLRPVDARDVSPREPAALVLSAQGLAGLASSIEQTQAAAIEWTVQGRRGPAYRLTARTSDLGQALASRNVIDVLAACTLPAGIALTWPSVEPASEDQVPAQAGEPTLAQDAGAQAEAEAGETQEAAPADGPAIPQQDGQAQTAPVFDATDEVAYREPGEAVWVVDMPAWEEQVWVVDTPAYDDTIWVQDSPATTNDVWVVDSPAWDEEVWVEDSPAWDERVQISAGYNLFNDDGFQAYTEEQTDAHAKELWLSGASGSYQYVPAQYETVSHEATGHAQTVHHEASGHWETQEVPASGHWETVHVSESGHLQTVFHDEEGHWE